MAQITSTPPRLDSDSLARLGLARHPFTDSKQLGFLFSDAAHKTQVNVALHMLQAGDRVLVVRGDPGIGKSSFLDVIAARSVPGMRFCHVAADAATGYEALTRRFLSDTGLADDNEELSATRLAVRLVESARAGQRPVLLLDDAARLELTVLERLLSLRQDTAADRAPFGLVLAVDPSFDATLETLRQSSLDPGQLHLINLFPYSEKQTFDYLAQRLRIAGDADGHLLSEADKRQIFQRSRGVPAQINAAATELLAARGGPSGERLRRLRSPKILIGAGSAATLALAAVLVTSLLPGSEPEPAAAEPAATPYGLAMPKQYGFDGRQAVAPGVTADAGAPPAAAQPAVEPTPLAALAQPAGEADASVEPAAIDSARPAPVTSPPEAAAALDSPAPATPVTAVASAAPATTPAISPIEPADSAPVAADPAIAGSKPVVVAPAPAPAVAKAPQTKPAPVAQTAPAPKPASKPAAKPTAVAASNPAAAALLGNQWLQSRPPQRYTIQLIGAHDREAVMSFVKTHRLQDMVALVRTKREGKDWFVVLLGDYPDWRAANAAAKRLPPPLRANSPWVRKFATLN